MDNNNKATVNGGTSISTLLQVAFIVLKLCKVINWSWWWVLSPLWIGLGITIIVIIIAILIAIFHN